MLRFLFLLSFCISLSFSLFAQLDESGSGYKFEITAQLDATEVKSQDRTGTCWSFSTVSFLESELIRMGKKPVDLSEMFVVRHTYLDKAERYVRFQGKTQFSQGSLCHDVINCLGKYGAVPESVFAGKKNAFGKYDHSKMASTLTNFVSGIVKSSPVDPDWKEAFDKMLDVYIGEEPKQFEFEGKTYTPRTFADSYLGLNAEDYLSISSYTHHPFYKPFVIEVPDNFSDGSVQNVKLDELVALTDAAIEAGYTLGWDADVSNPGFSSSNGIALNPETPWSEMNAEEKKEVFKGPIKEEVVSQESRQKEFDLQNVTDDHLMHITGSVKDQNGNKYYMVKNSWGKRGSFEGYVYVSESYFRMNTISVMLAKDALNKEMKRKLSL